MAQQLADKSPLANDHAAKSMADNDPTKNVSAAGHGSRLVLVLIAVAAIVAMIVAAFLMRA